MKTMKDGGAVRLALAMILCLTMAPAVHAAEDLPADRYIGGFPVGCQAYMFHRFTLFEGIEKTHAAGGKIIELFPTQRFSKEEPDVRVDQNLSDDDIAKLKAKLKENDVLAVSIGVIDIPRDEAGARKVFDFARKMGLRCITTEPAREQMDLLEKLVKEYDIQLAIHDHPRRASEPDYQFWDPHYVASLVAGRDARMGAMADVGHWTRSGVNPLEALKILQGHIIGCHLKDIVEAGNPDAPDVPLGEGVTGVGAILAELHRMQFKGYIFMEYERDWENSLPDIAACIGYVRGFGDAEKLRPAGN